MAGPLAWSAAENYNHVDDGYYYCDAELLDDDNDDDDDESDMIVHAGRLA